MLKFVQIDRQPDFGQYPHAFRIPDHEYRHTYDSKEGRTFWAAITWCEEQFGRDNQGGLYFTGTWAISSPQKPRIVFANKDDAFAFKMRWC